MFTLFEFVVGLLAICVEYDDELSQLQAIVYLSQKLCFDFFGFVFICFRTHELANLLQKLLSARLFHFEPVNIKILMIQRQTIVAIFYYLDLIQGVTEGQRELGISVNFRGKLGNL